MALATQPVAGAARFDARARRAFLDHLAVTANVAASAWAVTGGRSWRFGAGRWSDALEASSVRIAGTQVIGPQQPPIALPQGGTNPDTEARTAISMVINSLRAHGLISN